MATVTITTSLRTPHPPISTSVEYATVDEAVSAVLSAMPYTTGADTITLTVSGTSIIEVVR